MQDNNDDDDSNDSDPELSINEPIPKKKKKKATDESSSEKFWKYVLGKIVDGEEDKDGPKIIPLANTSYFLGKLLTKKNIHFHFKQINRKVRTKPRRM